MAANVLKVVVGLLLAFFLVPLFCFAGLIGGCFLMMLFPDASGQVNDSLMGGTIVVAFLGAILISVLIARGLRFGSS
ncbi:hypothetical protein IT575_15090 [bacterium]|nr:hypothetical protein [bacterium]